MTNISLPVWFSELLPAPADPAEIVYEHGVFVLLVNGGRSEFSTVDAAYDSVPDGFEVVFAESTLEMVDHIGGCMVTVPGKIGSRLLISRSDQDVLDAYVSEYETWLNKLVPAYLDKPSSFKAAYCFVISHPAFWTKQRVLPGEEESPDSWRWWNTTLNPEDVWQAPLWDSSGNMSWALELGSHIAPEYTSRYHDLRLDSYGLTIEDAWVELAGKVHQFFDVDGSERENVEYEKSELELKLESALSELEGRLE